MRIGTFSRAFVSGAAICVGAFSSYVAAQTTPVSGGRAKPTAVRAEKAKSNTDGFMGIKFGSSVAQARKFVASIGGATVEEEKSSPDYLFLDFSNVGNFPLGDLTLGEPFDGAVKLSFVNDQLYEAWIVLRVPETLEEQNAHYEATKQALDRYHHPSTETDRYSYKGTEKRIRPRWISAWKFEQPDGSNNRIVLTNDLRASSMEVRLINETLEEVATQKRQKKLQAVFTYQRASAYYKEKNYESAIPVFSEAIQLDPGLGEAYHYRGHSHNSLKKYDLAVADFTSALKIEPESSHYLIDRGYAYALWSDGKFDLALADLNRAIKIKANETRPYSIRARIFCHQGKKQLAAADEDTVVSLGGKIDEKCPQ